MRHTFNTLAGRTILISLLGISVVHALSLWVYERALERERAGAQEIRLADRLLTIKQSLELMPRQQREQAAHDLSSGAIEAHWSGSEAAVRSAVVEDRWQGLVGQLRSAAPDLRSSDLAIGAAPSDPHIAVVSMKLSDDSWLNVSLFNPVPPPASRHGALLSTGLMALGVVLLSVLITRWLTHPIKQVAHAAIHLTPGGPTRPVPEVGPEEVRELAVAFNDMQVRISELVKRRTLALAAVSHDLRTPLTRLKLRLEDPAFSRQADNVHDIEEMEGMIESTLAYLRGQETSEPARALDLVALLATIVGDEQDAGHDVQLMAPAHLVIVGRKLGLKRALSNVIENATRFGSAITIHVAEDDPLVRVTVDDNGPGIPEDQLSAVLEPFVRVEASRNRETGGVGLGLTIANANIMADGGRLSLENRNGGGLRVVMSLPNPAR